ncbi:GNAT family N-acetyltransferase [Pseudoalteromonas sp. MMG013]|uniref:GNAT family N-acetyltransferase n=1 Tax=Pseudoalteromonas sp. MMG013 TaxID=2822687 RepID=UPI001B39C658|nr:GNAT family N-acetyltransferase [Pseudoalteromonas sp. MMG013]MBQ4860225.1 GNAT family N-acetyltransferase [Pseudoalteromonas sp. MMG013]
MRNFYLKENIQNLLSLWHCYGDVSKHQNLRIHGQWPHKVWHEPLLFDEPANVIRGYKRDKPREKKGVGFDTKRRPDSDEVSTLVVMHKLLLDDVDITDDNTIKILSSESELDLWLSLGCAGFGYKIDKAPIARAFIDSRSKFYFILNEGEPVGTVLTWAQGHDVGIHQMTITQACRGRGLAGKALLQLEKRARGSSAKSMSLQASKKGLKIYESLGFVPLGFLSSYL